MGQLDFRLLLTVFYCIKVSGWAMFMFCRAESQGVVSATVFLFVMFCFTFVPFQEHLINRGTIEFPFNQVCFLD